MQVAGGTQCHKQRSRETLMQQRALRWHVALLHSPADTYQFQLLQLADAFIEFSLTSLSIRP